MIAAVFGASPEMRRTTVKLTQTGRMKQRLGATSWMSFTATQTISTCECAFDWRARFGPFGMISVRDALKGGQGRLDVMALGVIPIARAEHSSALMRGELMRYLAELAWAPDAILFNTTLRWRDDGPDRLAVSAGVGETAAEVTLSLDSDGRIAGAFAPDRPRSTTAPILPTPRRGRFCDYRHHGKYIAAQPQQVAPDISSRRIVVAHLGSGASLCGLEGGVSRDTSMGFSTLDGVPMAARRRNLDPGVLIHLVKQRGLSIEAGEDMLYHRSGLLGVSGISADSRDLIGNDAPAAREALDMFAFRIAARRQQ